MQLSELLNHFSGVKPLSGNNHYIALCPCHNDHEPSLDIRTGDKGIVMSCPVCGADGKRVMQALNLSVSELFYQPKQTRPPKPKDTDYYYTDTLKKTRFYRWNQKKSRYEKSFAWKHKSGGKWVNGLPKDENGNRIKPPLYHQNQLTAARDQGKTVYIVEGEKDVDTMTDKLHLTAVSSPHGASNSAEPAKKWDPRFNKLFSGANVLILPDNDESGKIFSKYIAGQLLPHAQSVKVLNLSDEWNSLEPKGDITDIFNAESRKHSENATAEITKRLNALQGRTPGFTPEPQAPKDEPPAWTYQDGNQLKLNEQMYVIHFVEQNGVRCINGQLFTVDGILEDSAAKNIIIREVLPYVKTNHGDKAKKLLQSIKDYAYIEPPKPDTDKLHFLNGTLSKDEKGVFTVWKTEKEFCINRINTNYNPYAPAPIKFLAYLDTVYEKDDQMTILQYLGYCLTPSTALQLALFIIGNGGEGKSVLGNIINGVIGEKNCYNASINSLDLPFGVANVENKLLMVDDDLSENGLKSSRMFKLLVTCLVTIFANKKGVQKYEFMPYVRFFGFGNFPPQALHDSSEGFARRLLLIQAKPKDKNRIDNPNLCGEILKEESEGVLLWLIDGLNTLIQNNFKLYVSDRTREESRKLIKEQDTVEQFLDNCEEIQFDKDGEAATTALFSLYENFCDDNALYKVAITRFSGELKAKSKQRGLAYDENLVINGRRSRGFHGIRIDRTPHVEM